MKANVSGDLLPGVGACQFPNSLEVPLSQKKKLMGWEEEEAKAFVSHDKCS